MRFLYIWSNVIALIIKINFVITDTCFLKYLLDQYSHDANGNITKHKESGRYSGTAKDISYTYDSLNRLTLESVTENNETKATMYGYDGFGNLTAETTGTKFINYTYNGLNQLTNRKDSTATGMGAFIGVTYSYDSHGNLTSPDGSFRSTK